MVRVWRSLAIFSLLGLITASEWPDHVHAMASRAKLTEVQGKKLSTT